MSLAKLIDTVGYSHSHATVYADLLRYMRHLLTVPRPQDQIVALMDKYNQTEHQLFNDMVVAAMKEHELALTKSEWADVFGDLYMELAGTYKASAMGQYFTPPAICNLMARLTPPSPEVLAKEAFSVMEPTCGSGRTLLAFHALHVVPLIEARKRTNSSVVYSAVDLDAMCVDMTIINMAIHGMVGSVRHGDGLFPDKTYGVYTVNYNLKDTIRNCTTKVGHFLDLYFRGVFNHHLLRIHQGAASLFLR
jgi:type I restriction enzyme M protein